MDARGVATVLSAGRVVIGLGLVMATRRSAQGWLGRDALDRPGTLVAIRGLGARDLAAGLGTLASLRTGTDDDVRRWLLAAVAGDTVDALATLAARRDDLAGRSSTVLAAAAAVTGAWAASRL